MNITLYVVVPNGLTFFFNATSDNTPLFSSNGKVNREVLEEKREEIFSPTRLLTTRQPVTNIPSIENCLAKWKERIYGAK